MKKIVAIVIILAFAMPILVSPSFAATANTKSGITDVGNKTCPVMSGPVSGKDFVVYKGKRYGLCCPMCKGAFLENPEKYIATMKEQTPASARAAIGTSAASQEMERDMEEGNLQ